MNDYPSVASERASLIKLLLFNLSFLVIFGLLGSVAGEIFLRIDGRYADLVNENLITSRAIWDRPSNRTQYRRHPDLDYEVEIIFNEFNARNHHGTTLHDVKEFQGNLIGVFGDSYTENRRIDDEFTFTSVLNEFLSPDTLVLNLGVDGYGLDQSYIKYLDSSVRSELDHVFYMFVENDLRNIYENQLFDFSSSKIGDPIAHEIGTFVEVARKFHMTYFLLDSYARLRATVLAQSYALSDLNNRIRNNLGIGKAHADRFYDEYAESMTRDFLSDAPSESTLEWVRRFRSLLEAWRTEVRAAGQQFVIFVIPEPVTTALAKKLFGQQFSAETVYLAEYFPEGYRNFRFENDGHWNEKGNLRAAQAIADWGASANIWPRNETKWQALAATTERAINVRYQQ